MLLTAPNLHLLLLRSTCKPSRALPAPLPFHPLCLDKCANLPLVTKAWSSSMTSSSDLLWPLYLYYLTVVPWGSNETMQPKHLAQAWDIIITQKMSALFPCLGWVIFPGIVSYILQGFQESAFLEHSFDTWRITWVPSEGEWLSPLGCFLTPTNSLTLAGWSTIQFNSGTNYLELAPTPRFKRSVPQPALTWDASHKSWATHPSD